MCITVQSPNNNPYELTWKLAIARHDLFAQSIILISICHRLLLYIYIYIVYRLYIHALLVRPMYGPNFIIILLLLLPDPYTHLRAYRARSRCDFRVRPSVAKVNFEISFTITTAPPTPPHTFAWFTLYLREICVCVVWFRRRTEISHVALSDDGLSVGKCKMCKNEMIVVNFAAAR